MVLTVDTLIIYLEDKGLKFYKEESAMLHFMKPDETYVSLDSDVIEEYLSTGNYSAVDKAISL